MTAVALNTIWRFYLDESRQWRWQQVSVSRVVLAESQRAYKAYEACVADAESQGYVYLPSKVKPHRPKVRES
jgi:hypothetical protein